MKDIKTIIDSLESELIKLNEFIFNNPELGNMEYKSAAAHMDLLQEYGFHIEKNYMDIPTAFKATYTSKKSGPTIGYLAEYDALPGIGHGCGHNILGVTSSGAAITLSKVIDDLGGTVILFGTPAEETNGAKVILAEKGAFNDVDIAMISHPSDKFMESGKTLAMEAIQFTFKGKSAHASSNPDKGINALDAAILTFNNINALREHIKSDTRIHGIIKEGGKAANIVPALAIAQFYIRSATKDYMIETSNKVKNCANAAALATGSTVKIENYEYSNDNLITNSTLSNLYLDKLKDLGIEKIYPAGPPKGSSDVGNVSHVCPTIHPYFSISENELVGHTKEFANATCTPYAYESMKKTIAALVLTAMDIIEYPDILKKIKDEYLSVMN
ncbi:M20 family metallopeptidase [Clostridiisalibacter paucivorans]|uniref:M20 family metallopeptidase n=1 Tax=Clostridiisalibacter paucivorans TaxID=408753 RepID=UPI00047B44CD|nr:M20 family metallopeptidase [Clostridiisalibacter paucivorans]